MKLNDVKKYTEGLLNTYFKPKVLKKFNEDENGNLTYNDEPFSYKISSLQNNALSNYTDREDSEENGIYVRDLSKMMEKLVDKKYSGLDKGYLFATNDRSSVLSFPAGTSLLAILTDKRVGDLTVSSDGYITLTEGVWVMNAGVINHGNNSIPIYWKDRAGNDLGSGGYTPSGVGADYNIDSYAIVEVPKDTTLEVAPIRIINTSNVECNFGHVVVHRIGTADVDPVAYVSEDGNLEETPIGHIISYIGGSTPKHYLTCDGSEYNINDYPALATHIKDEFGKYNYFGGDGITTFAVPDLSDQIEISWIQTNMTSDATPSPLKASASSSYSADYSAYKAFNNIYSSKYADDCWHTAANTNSGWLQIDFGIETKIDRFRTMPRNSSSNLLDQMPATFTFEGSNDGTNWDVLKSVTNRSHTAYARDTWCEDILDTTYNYRYYRLNVTNSNTSALSIGEMQFGTISKIPCIKYENTYHLTVADKVDGDSVAEAMCKPHLWPVGIEQSFGDNTYGRRVVIAQTGVADSGGSILTNLCTDATLTNAKIINYGGSCTGYNGLHWALPIPWSACKATLYKKSSNSIDIVFENMPTGKGLTNLDVWVLYTK